MKLNSKVIGYSIAILLLLSSSLVVLASGPVSADTAGNYTFTNDGTYATITGYSGSDAAVTIPATLNGFATAIIGNAVFSNHLEITSITIPASVTSVGNYAFANCSSLSSITFQGTTAPTVGSSWILGTSGLIQGYAPAGSNYGATFNGLPISQPTLPGAPTGLTATPGNGNIKLSWTVPSDGGSQLTSYVVTPVLSDSSAYNPGPSATSTTILGLTNGQSYTFQIAAINDLGQGPSSQSVTATPRTVPDQPTGLTATAGNGEVTLSWLAPSNDGGNAIDYYIISQNGTALPTHADGLTADVGNLQNGVSYNFAVVAHNAAGPGAASSAVPSTPRTVPGAPTALSISPSHSQIILSWALPSFDGGSSVIGYNVYRSTSQTGPFSLIRSSIAGTSFIRPSLVTELPTITRSVPSISPVKVRTPLYQASRGPFRVPQQ